MGRILLVLPLCLLLQGQQGLRDAVPVDRPPDKEVDSKPPPVLSEPELARIEVARCLGLSPTGFPGCVPWHSLYPIGNKNLFTLENILVYQPSLFLQMCLDKYDREIRGYNVLFEKQERVLGKLNKTEKINAVFREKPFSIHFTWLSGQVLAKKALYVEGENNGQMYAVPAFLPFSFPVLEDVRSQRAKSSGFYTLDQFGMKQGTQRTMASMQRAEKAGTLHVRYLGEYSVSELSGRVCYKFVRGPFIPHEEDGLNELTLYIDKETWLQVGSVLRDAQGQLIAEYWFRDLQLNPEYAKDQFTKKAL